MKGLGRGFIWDRYAYMEGDTEKPNTLCYSILPTVRKAAEQPQVFIVCQ